ncbi:sensor histidine kinase [Cohnella rhizosphaerae]|uniref:histidine kinase n=1 Tax=Cohnella rhizosphaerae TaxID=1457232 RepID=A0A9X4KVG0_9BACL|nr:sensor histidine kinase [Cohnella rhizosphaerae]MDG0809454.1 HAMP domain-containing protein [Cohnella rhizosphaerae]
MKGRVNKDNPKVLQWLGTVKSDDEREPDNYFIARALKDPADNQYLATLVIVISSNYFGKLFGQVMSGNMTLTDANGDLIAAGPMAASTGGASASGEIRNAVAIPKSGWSLTYANSKKEVTGQISRTFFLSILIVIPFCVVFLFISFYVAKRLHRPIRKLQTGVKQFGNGNRNIRFQAEGNDEIADLGRTLNRMLDQINALIADIEQEQEQKRVLELQALYSQIRPHFLLNTLNSIKCSLVLHDDTDHSQKNRFAHESLESLSAIQRGVYAAQRMQAAWPLCGDHANAKRYSAAIRYASLCRCRGLRPAEAAASADRRECHRARLYG